MKYKKHIIYEEKECPVCGKMFSGLRECCSNKCYQHQYYLKNIEARKKYKRKYFLENREKIKERYQKYLNDNKEIIKEKQREYYKEHRNELLEKQRNGLFFVEDVNEEVICDVVACSNDFINEVVEKFKKEML